MKIIIRQKYIRAIIKAFNLVPIVVLIGARQVGKTSIMKSLPKSQYKSILLLNGQDPNVAELFQQLNTIEQYLRLYLNPEMDGLLMLDEFQYIDNVSTMLKLLSDKYENLRILCSGSSSLDILQNVEESLAGRVRIIEVLSLSFSEYLLFKDRKLFQLHQQATSSENALIKPLLDVYREYLIFGGFPRPALTNDYNEKIELVNDIYQTYLLNDVRKYVKNEHFVAFNRLLRLLATQIGNLVNVNELSRESGLTYVACEKYIHLLQKMYIIRLVEPYASNKRKMISQMNKVYFYDLGLRNIIYKNFNEITFRTDNDAIFENEIMLELWRSKKAGEELNFYRTLNGTEVDFVLTGTQKSCLVECKYHNYDKVVKIKALRNLSAELNIAAGNCYVANINRFAFENDIQMIPGIWADRIVK